MTPSNKNTGQISISPDGQRIQIPGPAEIEKQLEEIIKKAHDWKKRGKKVVAVQGLGFVGSAVAAVIADARNGSGEPAYFVIGVDLAKPESYWKIAALNEGKFPVSASDKEITGMMQKAVSENRNLCAAGSEKAYSLADVIVVDVALDVDNRFEGDPKKIKVNSSAFESAIRAVGRNMKEDTLVIIETTIPVGTTEKTVLPLLREELSKRGVKKSPLVAHAYERVMPGPGYADSIRKYWRTFSGVDEASRARAKEFLGSFIETDEFPLAELEDTKSSEMAKLLENSYRAVNIAFIYEWTLMAEDAGVDLFKIIDSIRVRKGTHDNMRLPGFGVGGYCLPKDPLLAQWSIRNHLHSDIILDMTLEALSVNNKMPLHTANLLYGMLGENLRGKTVCICGVSYLPGVADSRNSPAEILASELSRSGATVIAHDPCLRNWQEKPDVMLYSNLVDCLKIADALVFTTAHDEYIGIDPADLVRYSPAPPVIVDSQNIITDEKAGLLYKAGSRIAGVGKGHWRKRGFDCRK